VKLELGFVHSLLVDRTDAPKVDVRAAPSLLDLPLFLSGVLI